MVANASKDRGQADRIHRRRDRHLSARTVVRFFQNLSWHIGICTTCCVVQSSVTVFVSAPVPTDDGGVTRPADPRAPWKAAKSTESSSLLQLPVELLCLSITVGQFLF